MSIVPTEIWFAANIIRKTCKTHKTIHKQYDIKYRALQQEIIQRQWKHLKEICAVSNVKPNWNDLLLIKQIAAGRTVKDLSNRPYIFYLSLKVKLCKNRQIWAQCRRSYLCNHLPVILVNKLDLTSPLNFTFPFINIPSLVLFAKVKFCAQQYKKY